MAVGAAISCSTSAIGAAIGALQAAALALVTKHPGLTATELAHADGQGDPRVLNRRLPELEKAGLVMRGEVRRCERTGRRAATWCRAR